MLAEHRQRFNRDFTAEKYQRFLAEIDRRSSAHVKFRNSESPCFFPKALLGKMADYGKELTGQLLSNSDYMAASAKEIPPAFRVANEDSRPMFLQADFGIDAAGEPKLVEIQGFPSLYAYQPMLAETYRDVYGLAPGLGSEFVEDYDALFRDAVLNGHDPNEVVLMEIDPPAEKTLCDFHLTEKLCGIKTVCITNVVKRGNRLYHRDNRGETRIRRIYNRAIVDEIQRTGTQPGFDFRDDLDVEWAGHPNWYFRISKFSLPYLRHVSVPKTWFLNRIPEIPADLENYVLKPLYSFAGLGVVVGPTREQVDAVDPAHYILQEKIEFAATVETPFGLTKTEVRVMYIWLDEMKAVTTIVRMGRGKMMGVDHNRDMEWVGASAGFFE